VIRRGGGLATVDTPATSAPPEVLMGRQGCLEQGCFASFEPGAASTDEIRYCNRGGTNGGHSHKWDGTAWRLAGAMEHDRS
jgi:hypothetical protein